jgi:SAM-dependent methyltransferase
MRSINKVDVKEHYTNYEQWKNWDKFVFGQTSRKEAHYFRKILARELSGNSRKEISILELGFGNGSLAGWLKTRYPEVTWVGVETQKRLVEKATQAGFKADSSLPDPVEKFDLVVAIDVLEHLTDTEIRGLFDQIKRLLKPNGRVIARSPNASGPFGLPNQTGDPTHITPISANRLSAYLTDWIIEEKGDLKPLWEGRIFSFAKNVIRATVRFIIQIILRFAFAPQPKTLFASNIHLFIFLRE